MIRTTAAQQAEMCRAIAAGNAYRNEKVWTYLVAHLLADMSHQVDLLRLFCGDAVGVTDPVDIWFEAQPLPPRRGVAGNSEGNTKVDLAFGHVQQRGSTGAGIAYGPHAPDSWVCFVEAKCLADCSTDVSYDPLRNQLTRVIENLLCFQANGQFPGSLIFTLVTPQLFKTNRNARLYGYKMREYEDSGALLEDIEACRIPKRQNSSYVYPAIADRIQRLQLRWITYEDVLQCEFGPDLDIVDRADQIAGLKERLQRIVELIRSTV